MRAAAYIRVSTEEQVEGFSLAAQSRAIRAYCVAQGWELVGEFVDEGLSASKESSALRPSFRRLMAGADDGSFDVIVVHKLDRFSRSVSLTLQSFARLHVAGCTFVSLSEHIDYSTPMGRLFLGMLALLAQFYSDNLATEVSKGRRERAAQGLWNGDLPFGYEKVGGPKGDARVAPLIVPEEAALVRRSFEWYASGTVTAHEIAEWLNGQGASPRGKGEGHAIGRFTKATVLDWLRNPFFRGMVSYRGELLAGSHEAIVSSELFDSVGRMLTDRRKLGPAVRRRHAHSYLLRGLARCSACNELLWCSPAANGDRYRDASKVKQRSCPAKRTSVTVEAIDEQVGQLVRRMVLPEDWRERVMRFMAGDEDAEGRASRRAAISDRMGRLREVFLDGDMRRGEYEGERQRLRAELDGLDAAGAVVGPVEANGELLRRLAQQWDAATHEERGELTQGIFAEVWVDLDKGEVAAVRPRPAFAALFEVLRAERVVCGDPEQSRVDHAQLYKPILELLDLGLVYRPGELGVA